MLAEFSTVAARNCVHVKGSDSDLVLPSGQLEALRKTCNFRIA